MIPWLYLKGVSTNDFDEALEALFGESVKGLSPTTISRLKQAWEAVCQEKAPQILHGRQYFHAMGRCIPRYGVGSGDPGPSVYAVLHNDPDQRSVKLWSQE